MKKNYDIILDPHTVIPFQARLLSDQIIDWGIKYVKALDVHNITKGKGAVVFVLDTAAEYKHGDLLPNALNEFGENFSDSKTRDDIVGHSTACSGIIGAVDNNFGVIGVAPEAKLIPYKVLNDQGRGNYTWLANAIKRAADVNLGEYNNYKRIISMSLGGSSSSQEVIDAVKYAISKNCILVAAAGNSYQWDKTNVAFPASIEEVIAVGAININEQPSSFSQGGALLDVVAPGEAIYTTYLNNNYGLFNGTSFSCPHVAGVCALILTGNLNINNQTEMSEFLKKKAKDIFDKGFDVRTGFGSTILPDYFAKEPEQPVEDAYKFNLNYNLSFANYNSKINPVSAQIYVELEIPKNKSTEILYRDSVDYFNSKINIFNNTLILSRGDKLKDKLTGEKFIIIQKDNSSLYSIVEEIYKNFNAIPYKVNKFIFTSSEQTIIL